MTEEKGKRCECHCHSETLLNGAKCKCIQNCVHCHPENFKVGINKEDILKAAKESSCIQRIQMKVWKFMEQPQRDRNSVKMAGEIFEDVKETIEKINEKI